MAFGVSIDWLRGIEQYLEKAGIEIRGRDGRALSGDPPSAGNRRKSLGEKTKCDPLGQQRDASAPFTGPKRRAGVCGPKTFKLLLSLVEIEADCQSRLAGGGHRGKCI